MKYLLVLFIATAIAQNPNSAIFPGGTVSDSDLLVANDLVRTQLNGAIDNVTTSISLVSASNITVPTAIVVESERMKCTSKVTNTLTCTRGQYGSSAVAHIDHTQVLAPLLAYHRNQDAAELKAIETWAQNIRIRTCEITVGGVSSTSTALADDDDTPTICGNDSGADQTVIAVACRANAGSPTVTPILTGGSATSLITGAITCPSDGTWAAGTLNGTPVVHSFSSNGATCSFTPCTVDANITTAGGVATYLVIKIVKKQ